MTRSEVEGTMRKAAVGTISGAALSGNVAPTIGYQAALMAAGKTAGAPIIALGSAAEVGAAAGPAGLVASAGMVVGGMLGDTVGYAIAGEDGAAVGKVVGGVGGAVGAGAGMGAVLGGPPGAAAGAVVGGVVYGANKLVEVGLDLASGKEGVVMITNASSKKVTLSTYNEDDGLQKVCYTETTVEAGNAQQIDAKSANIGFGSECKAIFVHAYVGRDKKTSGRGFCALTGVKYTWTGSELVRDDANGKCLKCNGVTMTYSDRGSFSALDCKGWFDIWNCPRCSNGKFRGASKQFGDPQSAYELVSKGWLTKVG